jgi:hypothetical protein
MQSHIVYREDFLLVNPISFPVFSSVPIGPSVAQVLAWQLYARKFFWQT